MIWFKSCVGNLTRCIAKNNILYWKGTLSPIGEYVIHEWGVTSGDIAQLGERGVRNAEVEGSNPSISTNLPL